MPIACCCYERFYLCCGCDVAFAFEYCLSGCILCGQCAQRRDEWMCGCGWLLYGMWGGSLTVREKILTIVSTLPTMIHTPKDMVLGIRLLCRNQYCKTPEPHGSLCNQRQWQQEQSNQSNRGEWVPKPKPKHKRNAMLVMELLRR